MRRGRMAGEDRESVAWEEKERDGNRDDNGIGEER